jgi:hypothetical protein
VEKLVEQRKQIGHASVFRVATAIIGIWNKMLAVRFATFFLTSIH